MTRYTYTQPVELGPHLFRLRPRCDGRQRLLSFNLAIDPAPNALCSLLDAEGNVVTRAWFGDRTVHLTLDSDFSLETDRSAPVDRLVRGESTRLPLVYPESTRGSLTSYLQRQSVSGQVAQLAGAMAEEADHDMFQFLEALTRYLYVHFKREIRDRGAPQTPERTLERKRGACRDLGVLFMAVCRCHGLAARFVSGYQAKAEKGGERRQMHAWPEVYLPAVGWRGFDPTHGSAVADAQVSVAAAHLPENAAPVEGTFSGAGVSSNLEFEIEIHVS